MVGPSEAERGSVADDSRVVGRAIADTVSSGITAAALPMSRERWTTGGDALTTTARADGIALLGHDVFDTLWCRNDMDEREAMKLALKAQRSVRHQGR